MYEKEKKIAIEAVTKAADLCVRVRENMVNPDALEKGDKSPVTVADFGAQALICETLLHYFPEDTIVGEEESVDLQKPANAPTLAEISDYVQDFHPDANPDSICQWIDAGASNVADRYWTVDPIDGTLGFLRNAQYAIALALVEHGEVKVGTLACPVLPLDLDDPESQKGVIFVAVRGQGAEMAPLHSNKFQPIHVASAAERHRLRFVESVEASHGNQPLQEAIARSVGITRPSVRVDSQVKYGVLARGDAVLYLRLPSPKTPNYCENIWDHAAGALIVEEAGGRVTDMYGNALDFSSDYKMCRNHGVIVSNGTLHQAVLDAIAHVEAG